MQIIVQAVNESLPGVASDPIEFTMPLVTKGLSQKQVVPCRCRHSYNSTTPDELIFLTAGILIVAFLYSSVGHAGASGYIAVMAIFGIAPAVIKPTALILNIAVACITFWHFWRAGHFPGRCFGR